MMMMGMMQKMMGNMMNDNQSGMMGGPMAGMMGGAQPGVEKLFSAMSLDERILFTNTMLPGCLKTMLSGLDANEKEALSKAVLQQMTSTFERLLNAEEVEMMVGGHSCC